MKKIFEKYGMLNCIGALMDIIAFILFIVSAFITHETADMVLKIVGLLFLIVGSMLMIMKSKEHRLAKSIVLFIITTILMTWLLPYGYFQSTEFSEFGMSRAGIADIGYALYYAVNFIMDKIGFLICFTGFYGVLAHVKGYQRLTDKLASAGKKHPAITAVIISVIVILLTSLFSQTFMVILFLPFFVTILSKMGLDRLTVFAITFGSLLVGILGCTYGTDSLEAFNYYMGQELTVGQTYRYIVFGVALVLYNFFLVMRVRKIFNSENKKAKDKDKDKENEVLADPFEVKSAKKASIIPVSIVLAITFIIVILGYITWTDISENITCFDTFHEWLTTLSIGEDFTIFSYILGSNADALGSFRFVFTISGLLLLVSALLAFLDRMSLNEFMSSFYEGNKKGFKPMMAIIGIYVIFGFCYLAPTAPTIANFLLTLTDSFNPYLTALSAFITSTFQVDLGYTAYTVGSYVVNTYAENIDIVHTIFVTMYGLVQVFMPTSTILVLGLSMMKVDYKDWLKYIWLFVVGMLVILLVLFTVVTYI